MKSPETLIASGKGREVRVEQHGKEIHLVFVALTQALADVLRDDLIAQLQSGGFNLTLTLGMTTEA
jgi:hypothetical protein